MNLTNLNLMIYHADLQPARGMIFPGVFLRKNKKKGFNGERRIHVRSLVTSRNGELSNEILRNSMRPGGVSDISGTPKSAPGTISDLVC